MAANQQTAFNPQGNTVVVAAASTAPDGVQVVASPSTQATGHVRIVNAGTNTVHLGVGATVAAAKAAAVAATAGNPAAGIPLVAGAVEIMQFPVGSYFSGYASANTTVYITPGTGL